MSTREELGFDPSNQQLIKWTRLYMICAGVWTLPFSENVIFQKIYVIYSFFMRISYALFFLLLMGETMRLIIFKYELPVIIATIGILFNAVKITLKMAIYLRYNILDRFEEVIVKEKAVWDSKDEEIVGVYRKNVKICSLYVNSIFVSSLIAVSSLQVTGSIAIWEIRKHNEQYNDTIEPHLMYQTLLPLNKLNHLAWFYASQALWEWIGTTYNTTTHVIYLTMLAYSATQLQILQIRFRKFVGSNYSDNRNEEEMREKTKVLKNLIKDHKYVIEFITFINKCTKYPIMVEYFLSSMDIAVVSVNLIKMQASEILWLLFFLVLLVLQITLVAWTCNEIKIQSLAIGDALYQSKWYLLDKEAKVLTQLVIARCQIPLLMTIGPFGPMSTGSALTVFKAAYSYISIMK